MHIVRRSIKSILFCLLGLLLLAGLGILYLTITEYRPKAVETLTAPIGDKVLTASQPFTVVTFNTGYAGLDASEDFFMDGGTKVRPKTKENITANLDGIAKLLQDNPADAYMLQEVDLGSKRSYYIDEQAALEKALSMDSSFAYNFKVAYVPYPFPTIGRVKCGMLTLTPYKVTESSRIALPTSFTWPTRVANLKRGLLVNRLPIENSTKEVVLVNLHLEAYDTQEGKTAQNKILKSFIQEEYEKGNYVIAGGDFNQTFEATNKYPVWNKDGWIPGLFLKEYLPEGFSLALDESYPTCRLLNAPYTGSYETSQVYVIDGFIVSPNVKVTEVKVINDDFRYSDHQPVKLSVQLLQ